MKILRIPLAAAIIAVGCTSNSLSTDPRLRPGTSIPPPWHYRNAYIEPDWHTVTKLLDVIEDPKASAAARHLALKKIRPLKVIEKPGFWTSILESPRFDDEHKRVCLTLLFTRHVPPGTRLTELAGIEGVSKWFTPLNVSDDSAAQDDELSSRGAMMFSMQPPLLVYEYGDSKFYDPNGAIYFSVSKKMTVDELIKAANTFEKWDGPELDDTYIVDLVASPGSEKGSLK
jgi:hypothetical protein